jgi:hypothetical protein
MSASSPLHAAAIELIPAAPIPTIRAILRLLLDAPIATAEPARRPAPPAPRRNGKRGGRRSRQAHDPDWEALRRRVHDAMEGRGVDHHGLAGAVGAAPSSVRVAIHRRQPPSAPLAAKLEAWLANGSPAPESLPPARAEVTAPGATFRRRGNGSHAGA